MLLKDFISDTRKTLGQVYPAPEASSMVEILCCEILGVSRQKHIIEPEYQVPSSLEGALVSSVERLVSGEPLQYILGFSDFYGYRFKVNQSVLIPRPETELLCREVVVGAKAAFGARPAAEPVRILDLCTGSGCIAWTLAAEIPGAHVTAVDISEKALAVAASQSVDVLCKPVFVKGDVLDQSFAAGLGEFDIVVSNPPYVRNLEKAEMRSNVLDHEPHLALFVPDEDPLVFYRAVARIASKVSAPHALVAVEINEVFAKETAAVFAAEGFADARTIVDFSGKDRHLVFKK